MKRLFLLLLLVPTLAACSGSHHGPKNNLIVLDRSIGGVALREPRSAVEAKLGSGRVLKQGIDRSAGPAPAHYALVAYEDGTLVVGYEGPRLPAIFVRTRSPVFHTSSGVGVGSSLHELRSKIPGLECFGGSDCQHGYRSPSTVGTSFVDSGGKVVLVAITFGH